MGLRITTWNANSIRLREACLQKIVEELNPDILCLQEIKCTNEQFPHTMIDPLNYPHRYIHGQKAYHGVAILSRIPLENCHHHYWVGKEESRHAVAGLPGGLELHNLYIPAGGDVPDEKANPKFADKLLMLRELKDFYQKDSTGKMILVGDLNIAPHENDVWSHKQLLKVVSHTPIEVEHLTALQKAGSFKDAVRAVIPEEEKLYSWWSYRSRDWSKSDKGRRLDHVWLGEDLASKLTSAQVTRKARGWEKPSDHVPISIELDL